MLSRFLQKSDCRACQFCCSYRRKSLWETPPFDEEQYRKLSAEYPEAKFKALGDGIYTIDLDDDYKTDDPEEEARCPFNREGCILDEEDKPFVCAIWPLRVMERGSERLITLASGCPVFAEADFDQVKELVENELMDKIFEHALLHPEVIEPYREGYRIIISKT